MDRFEKIVVGIVIGALGLVLGMLSVAFYIIWKSVFGA